MIAWWVEIPGEFSAESSSGRSGLLMWCRRNVRPRTELCWQSLVHGLVCCLEKFFVHLCTAVLLASLCFGVHGWLCPGILLGWISVCFLFSITSSYMPEIETEKGNEKETLGFSFNALLHLCATSGEACY